MSGKTATPTGSALTDTEFFAPLVSAWQPQDDQSTHAAYTASDLMTAEGSATTGEDNTLHLSFTIWGRAAVRLHHYGERVNRARLVGAERNIHHLRQ